MINANGNYLMMLFKKYFRVLSRKCKILAKSDFEVITLKTIIDFEISSTTKRFINNSSLKNSSIDYLYNYFSDF